MKFPRIILVLTALALAACGGEGGKSSKVPSNGSPYEVFIVADDAQWQGALGDTLRAVLGAPVEMINQYEPQFSVLRIRPTAFTNLIARHRNILIIKNGAEFDRTTVTAHYDLYAAPQMVLSVTGPTLADITAYVSDHRTELVQVLELAERDRALAANRRHNQKTLSEMVGERFGGMHIDIPQGFGLRGKQPDFIYFSHERPISTQGIFIYSYPYEGKEDFEPDRLIARRNEFAKRIPGPSKGSYMATVVNDSMPDVNPYVRYVSIGGRHWAKMSGFWNVHNDFMGGPFFSYSTLDRATGRIVTVDCFVFSPKHPKRNIFRQLEDLVFSVTFPAGE